MKKYFLSITSICAALIFAGCASVGDGTSTGNFIDWVKDCLGKENK